MMMEMSIEEKATATAAEALKGTVLEVQPPPPPPAPQPQPISTASSWLLTTLADAEEKMKLVQQYEQDHHNQGGDTLAQRAESYYTERPRLLALVQHLYNSYLSLAHRYSHHHKQHNPHPPSTTTTNTYNNSTFQFDFNFDHHFYQHRYHHHHHHHKVENEDEDSCGSYIDDAKSSLSYQQPTTTSNDASSIIITELIMKQVECHLMAHDMGVTHKKLGEWTRKMELQKSLLEVLESERLVLLNENARLGYKVVALVQENKGLTTESISIKRKAVELATCVLKMRDDERICTMSRKIQHLQGHINRLEKRNRENYDELVKVETPNVAAATDKTKASKWWDKFKKIDLFLCGPTLNTSSHV